MQSPASQQARWADFESPATDRFSGRLGGTPIGAARNTHHPQPGLEVAPDAPLPPGGTSQATRQKALYCDFDSP